MIDCTKCWNYEECITYPDDMDECVSHDWDRYMRVDEDEDKVENENE